MKVVFNINYNTVWRQRLCIVGSVSVLGNWEEGIAPEMTYAGNGNWQHEIELPEDIERVEYRYFICSDSGEAIPEWSRGHVITPDGSAVYRVYDSWLDRPGDLPFYSSAFTEAIFYHPPFSEKKRQDSKNYLKLSVIAAKVERHQYVALTGNQNLLGDWMPEHSMRMYPSGQSVWNIVLDASEVSFPLSFKFLLRDENDPSFCQWEEGGDRRIDYPFLTGEETACVSGTFFRYGNNQPLWKGAGTVIPVFSLRSEQSYGVGDLGDLLRFVDWVKITGQCLIQLLPMNDTRVTQTWLDSYPYSALSIYALHPMYIDLRRLGELNNPERKQYYQTLQYELNAKTTVDYEAVVEAKLAYIREFAGQEGLFRLMDNDEYRLFFEKNSVWLMPYAAYCYLKDLYKTVNFNLWGNYATYDQLMITKLCSPRNSAYPEIAFCYYLQFLLDKQFREVTAYARANGVILKGDLPIGVNKRSVKVWTQPANFNLNGQSGAPPDAFSTIGQNWFFPTYRWDEMAKDGYIWWKNRFAKMNDFFDCFRIDHILGFFRIWEIPEEYVQGLCGHFNPALPLSIDEIERYGLHFDEKRFISPRVHEQYLTDLFGEYADEAQDSFLAQSSSHHYVLKPFCDTQQKVASLFEDRRDEKSIRIKSGLYAIANEVLFLKDPREAGKYHPRISASMSYLYRELNEDEKRAFDQLYEDFFYHRHNEFWKEQALDKLTPLVESTRMLVCGEDLGMIPATVPEVMNALQLLSLEIERMPKTFGLEFADLKTLPYYSVCTTSTHDMSPLRSWWTEDREKTQRYYNSILQCDGEAPADCPGELARRILENHLHSPSMLAIIPWQDWIAIDDHLKYPDADAERINIPAQTNHYWRYRMHLTIEELMGSESLNTRIRSLIEQSGRV